MSTYSTEGFLPMGAGREGQLVRQRHSPGTRVCVRNGVFAGVEGTVASYGLDSRVIIAVDLDRKGVSLEIDERMVESISR